MHSRAYSFKDIFATDFAAGQVKKISIPIIQRDYAQGRRDPEIERVRGRFLDSLYSALKKPITLDFVYGDIDEQGIMTPLDGQQRLTTLFLLHWYAAKKANIAHEESAFLSNFGYETRYSARSFCKDLIDFTPSFTGRLSDEIIDQPWFPLNWRKDPTIDSMLVMLDAIDDKFKDVASDLWEKLKNITFFFLPIKDMGLTDELYIKMNSRGKPLTRFEHFKAMLERCIQSLDDKTAERIMGKIDRDWTDLLWCYRNFGSSEDMLPDDKFLMYFHFICDVICYQGGGSPQGKSSDEFDMPEEYFTGAKNVIRQNIELLESYFDCWCALQGFASPTLFLESCMSHSPGNGKIVVDRIYEIDIFKDCLHSYGDKSGRIPRFPLHRFVLLYAITSFLRNRQRVTDTEFRTRLRSINNLIQNSENEIRDNSRLPAILQQTEAIMLTCQIDHSIGKNFNVYQIDEEEQKKNFLSVHPGKAALVHELEDHRLLKEL